MSFFTPFIIIFGTRSNFEESLLYILLLYMFVNRKIRGWIPLDRNEFYVWRIETLRDSFISGITPFFLSRIEDLSWIISFTSIMSHLQVIYTDLIKCFN